MSRTAATLRRLERQWARRELGRVLPIKSLAYDDGLYHEGNRTYTEDEVTALKADYQLIIVCYSDDAPPGDGEVIQMTWGDDALDSPY